MSDLVEDYDSLLGQIKERVRSAQYEALKVVNKELINLYCGKMQFYLAVLNRPIHKLN